MPILPSCIKDCQFIFPIWNSLPTGKLDCGTKTLLGHNNDLQRSGFELTLLGIFKAALLVDHGIDQPYQITSGQPVCYFRIGAFVKLRKFCRWSYKQSSNCGTTSANPWICGLIAVKLVNQFVFQGKSESFHASYSSISSNMKLKNVKWTTEIK